MYAKSLQLENFKCFGQATLNFQYPGRIGEDIPALPNVNLVLGDNGGGKSSILRAIAIAFLAPALSDSGFVPWRLVRRAKPGQEVVSLANLLLEVDATGTELFSALPQFQIQTILQRRHEFEEGDDIDRLVTLLENESIVKLSGSPDSFPFIVGYGATRRLEIGDYSESSARRSRGLRYARVAGLFEDHLALRPMSVWARRMRERDPQRYQLALEKFNQVLPANLRFEGEFNEDEGQAIFVFDGASTPLSALSDGYKSFVGCIGDLIGRLLEATESPFQLDDIPGIVLLDEIDLHLHPAWQRSVIPSLARAFPKLQFFFTSHSPLVASTVQRQNVFVTETAADGTATVKQLQEHVYGRSVEELLLSSYFGLQSTRPEAFQEEGRILFTKAAQGDAQAALEYLRCLTGTNNGPDDNTQSVAATDGEQPISPKV